HSRVFGGGLQAELADESAPTKGESASLGPLGRLQRLAARSHDKVPGVHYFPWVPMRALFALLLCLALPAHADGFLSRLLDKPVPGGVAVVDLGDAPHAPQVSYQDKPALVVREDDQRWIAIIGVPLRTPAGAQTLLVDGQSRDFAVGERLYREQHITLKNKEQVNPGPEALA